MTGSAILLTDANNQASFPADKNVIGGSQYNVVNGPEGSCTFITMGYGTSAPGPSSSKNMLLQAALNDVEYNNAKLVIQSIKY